ncbi:MAG TPA: DUF1800 domain-containing protein [Vicinamibacterales bacterium]|nr:DUF1800 domain-containing protein [Vicinamibacterales bacterium]
MPISAPFRRIFTPLASALLVALAFAYTLAHPAGLAAAGGPPANNDDKSISHVLDRLGYGPRPGDVEKVRQVGVMNYIDQQLHPEKIDDSALEARLAPLKTIDLSSREIARDYYQPAQVQKRQQKQAAGKADPADAPAAQTRTPEMTAAMMKQREVVMELDAQKILRATYSDRQLEQVLTDFWFNHFNVFAGKGPERLMLTEYERDVIRPNVLGNFRDLLGATAHSPAMLFYLDNWMSTDPKGLHQSPLDDMRQRNRARRLGVIRPDLAEMMKQQQKNRPSGLNENYGRELMELHTLGVEGGYTQKDVVEVARAFTGWTIAQPRTGGGYRFDPRMHDNGEKNVLGHIIKAGGGEKDGEQVLDILAQHPSTARFISTKLARRFVGDEPSAALIDRASKRFLDTHGDLREVVRTILTSPEFFAPGAYRAKVKTPFEFLVSALRAADADIRGPAGLIRSMQQLGMPLYQAQPPTGYADTADAWVNTGGLVSRMNFALSLVKNQVQGVRVALPTEPLDAARDRLVKTVLQGQVSDATVDTLHKAKDVTQLTALALGAPEFQRR